MDFYYADVTLLYIQSFGSLQTDASDARVC